MFKRSLQTIHLHPPGRGRKLGVAAKQASQLTKQLNKLETNEK